MMTGPKPSSDFGVRCGSGLTNQFLGATECALLGVRYTSRVFSIVERSFEPPAQRQRVEAGARGARRNAPTLYRALHFRTLGVES